MTMTNAPYYGLTPILERLQLGPDGAQRRIVFQQALVNFRQTFEDGGVGEELLAGAHKGADDKHTHFHRLFAVEDVGGHQRAVFGKDMGQVFDILPALQGHNL